MVKVIKYTDEKHKRIKDVQLHLNLKHKKTLSLMDISMYYMSDDNKTPSEIADKIYEDLEKKHTINFNKER